MHNFDEGMFIMVEANCARFLDIFRYVRNMADLPALCTFFSHISLSLFQLHRIITAHICIYNLVSHFFVSFSSYNLLLLHSESREREKKRARFFLTKRRLTDLTRRERESYYI